MDEGDEFEPLFSHSDSPFNLSASEAASCKNQLMDDLLAREDIPEGYAAAMEALYRDRSNDDILRGFAIQHFPLHAETLARRGQFDSATPEAARVRETLFEAARETSSSVGGTALLALERLSHTDPSVDRDALCNLVLGTARDASAAPATRLAAVQLCGTVRLPAALPLLRTLSDDDTANTALRLAALYSLSAIESATMPGE